MNAIKFSVKYIVNLYKKIYLKKDGIYIGTNVSFRNASFSRYNKILKNTQINDTSLGSFSYIGQNVILNNVNVGSFCSIAPFTKVIYGNHPLDFVSTHPLFYSTRKQCGVSFLKKNLRDEFTYVANTNKSVIIHNDVWIGYGVKLIEGVTIHNGAVILAGAVVTKDVPPYAIVGGIPAKLIKYRFDELYIKKLLQFEWWNKDIDWIKMHMNNFTNIDKFISTFCMNGRSKNNAK